MSDEQGATDRYARQSILPAIGAEGQAKIRVAHALIVGAGGLGVPVLQYLAGAGIGRLTIIDPDAVALSNLHRQPLYREDQIGRPKVKAAAPSLRGLNDDVELVAIQGRLSPANAARLVAEADIVIDCADSFAVSYTLSDICFKTKIPLVTGSALGLEGYAAGVCGGAPSLRAVFPDLPARAQNCATAGVLGPVVGIIGSLQAQMALAILVELTPSPLGQMVTVDAASYRFGGFRFDNAPEPAQAGFQFIAPDQATDADFLVELRGGMEAPAPFHAAAMRAEVGDFGADGPAPSGKQRAVFCCRSGLRAWQAASRLAPHTDCEIVLIAAG
ncbi:MAG: HesA/MoeB/ThiF family protein [Alphaproteobacteria bacterium]|nr:HesA/MoeB/ThiF family protein [Alphaproteobacteria bacterium SS10]